jgi:pimeloyl-ACP methyl ester carboxylesterase
MDRSGRMPTVAAMTVLWPFRSRAALARAYARPQSRFATVGGVHLHYLDEGPADGPVVVVLPAQWTSFAQYDDWAPALTDRYRVLRIDLPGQGLSGRIPSSDYSMAMYQQLLTGLLDQIGVDRFFLVGTSFSGTVAFRHAAVAGDRLLGLVLANASGMPRLPGHPNPGSTPPTAWLRRLEPYFRPKAYFRWKLDELMQDKARITPERVRQYRDMNNAPGRIGEAAARARTYRSGDPLPVLAAITAPVLVQWSTHATYLPAVDADRFEAALTSAAVRKIIYPGVGHLIIEDAPVATSRDVRLFLDAVMSGRPIV